MRISSQPQTSTSPLVASGARRRRPILFACHPVEAISTGLPALDNSLGIGGLPRGALAEVFGAESTGKTALALALIRATQAAGGIAAFIDAEHSLDARFAERLGVNLDELLFLHPAEGDRALTLAIALLEARTVDILVLDSLAAITPASERSKSFYEMGLARFNYLLWKMAALNARTATAVILVNQIRSRLADCVGEDRISPGGWAPKLLSAVRMELLPSQTPPRRNGPALPVCARLIKNRYHVPDRVSLVHLELPFHPSRPSDTAAFEERNTLTEAP